MNTNNEWCVYKHTSPSGKVYIGITKDVKHRWRNNGMGYKGSTRIHNAIMKYGWENFKHEILFTKLSQQEACRKEIELIKYYKSTDVKYGYNLQSGGQSFISNEESRQKISAALKGHIVSDKTKAKLSKANSKPIICIETHAIYENCNKAAENLRLCSTSIGKAANGKQENCGGLHFAKVEDYINDKLPVFNARPVQYRKVRCVSTGRVFESISEASRITGVSRRAISYACNGKHKTSGGFIWEFVNQRNSLF